MAFDLSEITELADLVAHDPKVQAEIWSEAVRADARDSNPLKDFMGSEGSGMPICEKRDHAKGGGQKVWFSTRAPVLGRGVIGSAELKSKTARLRYGTFGVTVDLRRFAISEEQLVQYFTLPGNAEKNRDEVLLELSRDWWVRTVCDDIQIVLRNAALLVNTANLLRVGNGANSDALTPTDTFDTSVIEDGKEALKGQGALAMDVAKDRAGSDIPQYLVYGPSEVLEALEDEQKFREAIHNNGQRSDDSIWFSGKYPMWKNNLIFRHNLIEDSGPNRQGSPLLPKARLGVALADETADDITGGGAWNDDGSLTDVALYDFFSYFGGFGWKTYETESLPTDNATRYAIIYNVTGADRGKYEIISYNPANNNGNTLSNVTRELNADQQKDRLTLAGRYTNAHPTGSLIIPCNKWGVPIGYALHMGAEALLVGKGAMEADPIRWGDDFESMTSGQEHIRARGIQSIIGYSPYIDTAERMPNFILVECAVPYRNLNLEDVRNLPAA